MLRKCLLLGILTGVLLLAHMAPSLLAVAGGSEVRAPVAPAATSDPGASVEPILLTVVLGGGVVVLVRQRRHRIREQRYRS